jgi:regulator of protease activity HflC (stomatin/prohibitin superfamily)
MFDATINFFIGNWGLNGWSFFRIMIPVSFWLYKCINVLKEDQIAIKITLGRPAEKGIDPSKDGGVVWIFWPFQWLPRFTKNQLSFKFMVKTVATSKGKVKGFSGDIEPLEMDILCTIFAYFNADNLKKTIEKAPGRTAKSIGPKIVAYTRDSVRAIGGRIPWRLLNQERHEFSRWILARLVGGIYPKIYNDSDGYYSFDSESIKGLNPNFNGDRDRAARMGCYIDPKELEKSSPFLQFGLNDVSFLVEDVNFSDSEMKNKIGEPEKARLGAEAIIRTAQAEKQKKILEGEGDASARRSMVEVIKDHPDLEVMYMLKEMAQGTSNTILYQMPQAFENRVRDILGGNTPAEFLKFLSDDEKKTLAEVFKNSGLSEEAKKVVGKILSGGKK